MAIFLGTGAAQGFPSPYCKCPTCEDARRQGGKAIKSRTDFLIDEENIIDFGPDILSQLTREGIMLDRLKNIFLTHSHEDHIAAAELSNIANRKHTLTEPVSVNLFGTKSALEVVEKAASAYSHGTDFPYEHIKLHPIEAFNTFNTGTLKVTPLLSSHKAWGKDELALNYIIEKNGKILLYACDTGWYPNETWGFLSNNSIRLDIVVMENTYGKDPYGIIKPEAGGHLNTKNFFAMLEKLKELDAISSETPVYANHLSDACKELYGEFVSSMEQNESFNITVAYDGLKIEF